MMFLNDLRTLMGKTSFAEMLQDYYTAEVYKVTTPDAFFDAVARHTDEDISDLVGTYFDKPPALPCTISNNAPDCRK
jgi:aminopeptidase N